MIASGGGRFRGIRFISASHPDQAQWGSAVGRPERLLLDKRVREGFAPTGARSALSFDAFMYHTPTGRPARPGAPRSSGDTDRAEPCRRPDRAWGATKGKRDAVIRRLERPASANWRHAPNVHVKLGGLGMRLPGLRCARRRACRRVSEQLAASWRPLPSRTCHHGIRCRPRHVRKQFPRSTRGPTATACSGTPASDWPQGASASEKASLFHGAASRVYRLGV